MNNHNKIFHISINFPIKLADTFIKRFVGFMGQKNAEHGLLFVPCKSIHTFFMKMDIDVVYLDSDFKVIEVLPCLKPWKIVFNKNAYCILELPAGITQKYNVTVGHHI